MKKVVSILLVLLMLLSTSAVGTISASAASNIVIAGVDIGYANGDYFTKNGKSCANSYWASGRCHHNDVCEATTHSQCNCMRYWPTGKSSTCEVDLKASQCFGFARYCQWIVYGYHDASSGSKFTDVTGTITNCTGSKLKSKLIDCAPATHVRTLETKKGWGHSIVIISTSDYGVNIADANNDGYCKVRYATYSWDQLATWVNEYGGINYANSSKSITHVHDYVAEGYEQAHPHKVFRKCACGDWYYTGATKTLDTCLTCNPTTLKVYFNANGGSISSDTYKLSSNLIYNKSDSSKYYQKWTYNNTKENGLVNASTFGIYKTGYTFNGWGTKASGGTIFDQGDNTLKPTDINANIKNGDCSTTLYAQWVANSYKIAFNGNGATSGSMSNLAMTYGTAKNLTANSFVKTGYTFNGWNTKADGSGTAYANKASVKNLTSANGGTITLYAQWKANSYTIAFNGNGATSGSMSNLAMTYGIAKNLTANAFVKTGYTFNGWNTKADGSGTAYANKSSVKNLTSAKGGTITLYAQWKANPVTSYTVSYNANGGSVSPSSASVTEGNSVTLPTPTKSYTITYNANGGNNAPSSQSVSVGCKGWATSSSASSSAYSCGASYKPTANVILYAVWNSSANKTLSTTTPTRNGYTFLGWSTSNSATSATWKAGSSINITGNTTLYAVWQKIETPAPTPTPAPEVVYKTVALNYKDIYQINIDEFDAVKFVAEDDSVLTVDSDGTVKAISTGSADVYVYDSNSDVRMVYTFEVDYAWWQWIILIVLFGWIWY